MIMTCKYGYLDVSNAKFGLIPYGSKKSTQCLPDDITKACDGELRNSVDVIK